LLLAFNHNTVILTLRIRLSSNSLQEQLTYIRQAILANSEKSNSFQTCLWADLIVCKRNKTIYTVHEAISNHLIKMFQNNCTRLDEVNHCIDGFFCTWHVKICNLLSLKMNEAHFLLLYGHSRMASL
jgi:hypothetical protein